MIEKKNFVSFRKRVWTLLEPAAEDDKASKITDIFLVTLIMNYQMGQMTI